MTPPSGALRGIAAMLAAQFAFLLNDTCVKLASERLPMGEIVFLRGVFATAVVSALAVGFGLHRQLPSLVSRLVTYRVLSEIGAMFFYIAALIHMPIANTTIIFQATPLAVTAAAALFAGEAVGWRRWIAIAVGFVGVLIVVRPGLAGFDFYSLLVLVSVLFVTARDVATRALSAAVPTLLLTFATAIGVTFTGAILGTVENWMAPSASSLALLAAAGVLLSIGYAGGILALRLGEMSLTASFRYSAVVFAIFLGYLVWSDVPDALTIVGSLIIVATGLYTLYRERKVARSGRLVTAPAAIDPPGGG